MTKKKIIYIAILLLVAFLVYIFSIYFNKFVRVLMPIIFGFIISYLITPLVNKMENKRIHRAVGIIILYFFLVCILIMISFYVFPLLVTNIGELIENVPNIINIYNETAKNIATQLFKDNSTLQATITSELQRVSETIKTSVIDWLKNSINIIPKTTSIILSLLLGFVIAFYITKDIKKFKLSILSIIPSKYHDTVLSTLREMNYCVTRFVQGQLMIALIVGILEGIGLYFIGVPYAAFLGFLGGIANIIPYFGPYIGGIPAVVIALFASPYKALWTLAVFILVQQIDNILLSPKMMEGKLGIHPVTTMMVILIGGEFFGILGMIFAVPTAAIIKMMYKKIVEAIV